MQGVELEILLEDPKKTYAPGDHIKGKVRVIVSEARQCLGLNIMLTIRGTAQVKGGLGKYRFTHLENKVKNSLFQGPWSVDIYEYPFKMEIHDGPFSYQGKIIQVSWLIRAEALTSGGGDIVTEKELSLVPGKPASSSRLPQRTQEVVYKETPKSSLGCLFLSLFLFLAGAGLTFRAFQSGKDSLMGWGIFLAILGLIIILINLYMIMISQRIALVEARILSGTVSPGEMVPVRLLFQVKKPVELKGIWVTLIGQELAGNVGLRASKKTYLENLCLRKKELPLPIGPVPANVPVEVRGDFSVPSDAPLSLHLADTLGRGIEVRWEVEFRMAMERWPDWFCKEKITITPGVT
jgi:hypothetical protein